MCNLRRSKPSTNRPRPEEQRQERYDLQPRRQEYYLDEVERGSNGSRQRYTPHAEPSMRPLPPSTGGTSSRVSLSSSIRSYATNLSLKPGGPSAPIGPGGRKSSDSGPSLETLPTELLEVIFLLAIQTSFPAEDPNWPACPMFSRRSYHSPSNSGSGYSPGGVIAGIPSESVNPPERTAKSLRCAPHLLPTVLSQTCRRFRSVLRHAPHLWSYLNLTRTVSPHQGQQPLLARQILGWLPIYLARSRESLLHITFDTTKFASFGAPLSHSNAPATHGVAGVHPQSIIALLLPTISRWSSVTILTSHIGSTALTPLLDLLSPLNVPGATHLRLAADIWRPGIVGYGTPVPKLFSGGSPNLRSVVLEGLPLDWKSCAGVGLEPGAGFFGSLRDLELRFIAGRYPRWEQFAILLEEGCPRLERLVVRDDFDEVLRTLDPPPSPWFEDHSASTAVEGSSSGSGRTSSISASSRLQSHIAGLHITLPPSTDNRSVTRRRGRSDSASSSSSSSGSSSSSSSPTSPNYLHSSRKHRRERHFRKIHLPGLQHLEVHGFNSNGSRSNLAFNSSPPASRGPIAPHSVVRFLYLLSTPAIHTLRVSGLEREGWLIIAGMLGLPSDGRLRVGALSAFPFLVTLAVEIDS